MYLVICNAPPEESKALARKIAGERLAACINIIPGVQSYYWWKDRFCEEDEDTLLIKVTKDKYEQMCNRLRELHPYSVPEIVAIEPAHVHEPYLAWLRETMGG